MVIAVTIVCMMQVSSDDVVRMIAVGDCLVSAGGAVDVRGIMRAA